MSPALHRTSCFAVSRRQFGDGREVVVIMFGDKEGVINEPHRRTESRMECSAGKDRRIGSSQELHELATRGPKGCKKLGEMARVVIRLVSPSVRRIGRKKLGLTCE